MGDILKIVTFMELFLVAIIKVIIIILFLF